MQKRKLLYLFLLLFILLPNITNAYKPIVQIGKPPLDDIAYSPDGRYLGVLNRAYLELMNPETMETVIHFGAPNQRYGYRKFAFSPDSSIVALYEYGDIQIWDIATQIITATIYEVLSCFEFSPDGKYLAYAKYDDSVFLWDMKQKKVVKELTGDPQPMISDASQQQVTDIKFLPNSNILAVGSLRKTIALWDIKSQKISSYLKLKYAGYTSYIKTSHNGSLLAVRGTWSSIELVNVATGESSYASGRDNNSVAFTADDKFLLIGEGYGHLAIYDIATSKYERKQVVKRLPSPNVGNWNSTEHIAVSPDGKRIATVLNYSRLYIWDAKSFEEIKMLYGWMQTYFPIAYLPKANHIVTGIYTNEIVLWDVTTGKPLAMREFYLDVEYIKASPDGKTFAIALNNVIYVYNGSTLRRLQVFDRYGHTRALDFSPSGRYLISNGWFGTYVWDIETGDEIAWMINTGWEDYPILLFTPDEKQFLMIPPERDETEIWDIDKGSVYMTYKGSGPTAKVGNDFIQARRYRSDIQIFLVKARKQISQFTIDRDSYWAQWYFSHTKIHPKGNLLVTCPQPHDNPNRWDFYDPWTGDLIRTNTNIDDIDFADDKYVFIRNNKHELGLYLISDVIQRISPEDKEITQFARLKENQLLPNYPNPFNPETWIPYELSENSDVVIRIYTAGGQIVRTLVLGNKQAGIYKDRKDAAYWDGKDNSGQLVGSGLYFYCIQAGDFIETKKMVVIR